MTGAPLPSPSLPHPPSLPRPGLQFLRGVRPTAAAPAAALVALLVTGCAAGQDGESPAGPAPAAPPTTSSEAPPADPGGGGPAAGACLAAVDVDGRRYVGAGLPPDAALPPPTGPVLAGVVPGCADGIGDGTGAGTEPVEVEVRALEGVPVEDAVLAGGQLYLADPVDPPEELAGLLGG
ncbi:hypothetical protein [Pseudokineococcus sp. 1T1Z-3]|uniref:hypothetical protein n=1 Tax=Pseudokineococcus sp. 1T1Z-3 TaxID=3132745 RepID=UPI0030A5F5B5